MIPALLTAVLSAASPAESDANIAALVEQLRTGQGPGGRVGAAKELAELGPKAKAAIPALCEALQYKDGWVRGKCAEALAYMGPDAAAAVGPLTGMLTDRSWDARVKAATALGWIGSAAKPSAAGLATMLAADKDADARSAAAWALGRVGAEPSAALPALKAALADGSKFVRVYAADSLLRIEPTGPSADAAREVLAALAGDADPQVRAEVARVRAEAGR